MLNSFLLGNYLRGGERSSLHAVSWPTNYNHFPDRMENADLVRKCVNEEMLHMKELVLGRSGAFLQEMESSREWVV